MVSLKLIEKQLKTIGFNYHGWGRTEAKELANILLPDEEIFECVNGFYDGGFALLVATDVRVLLIDKKPLNYLTVDDLRFDMINELDYSHRLLGAHISISAGNKNLKFTSLNQPRLRKLIGHVQRRMAEVKRQQSTHQEAQNQHLEQINQQLQSYLLAQYEHQEKLHEELRKVQDSDKPAAAVETPQPVQPSRELADYLYAQSLLAQHQASAGAAPAPAQPVLAASRPALQPFGDPLADLYEEGRQEIFGKRDQRLSAALPAALPAPQGKPELPKEISALGIAYSKLPQVLRGRKFGKSLLATPSQEAVSVPAKA
ncbi:MAG TPA: PH domain-containing protein [Candidatus Saccharimonadales bacterium]